jgi:[ribosomal protein S18]-alanine N-acetyltransferase
MLIIKTMVLPRRAAKNINFNHVGMEAVMELKKQKDVLAQSSQEALRTQIRWLIRRDMDEVLAIERASFEFPWTEEEFLCCLRQRNCIGTVAELDHEIVGFMIYELHQSMLRILNFAVAPKMRRQGVGGQMVQRLVDKLSQQRRREIVLEVRETNLDAQLFFKNSEFKAVHVLRNHYDDTLEDAYYMRYSLKNASADFVSNNRLSGLDAA